MEAKKAAMVLVDISSYTHFIRAEMTTPFMQ